MERNKTGSVNIIKDLTKEIAKNFLMGIPTVRRLRLKRPRTATSYSKTDEFLKLYAFYSLNTLREYLGDLRGKSICEIGAGDYLTSGLSILASGASRYTVIDRFAGDYYSQTAKHWYKQIQENWQRFYPETPWDKTLDAENFPENSADRIELIKEPIETAESGHKFDVICSFQVGEHVSDINAFAKVHRRLLKDDGAGLHRVDFGPHDCWCYYRDPTTFLRFPDFFWHLSSSNRGTPNRRRHHEFMAAFEQANLKVEILKLEFFDEDAINFQLMDKKFITMPRDSLLVGTAIYRLSKR
jgi:SAM-dependent methyltransferase